MPNPEQPINSLPDPTGQKLLVFSKQRSDRFDYACQLVFRDVCRMDFGLTGDVDQYLHYPGPRINYSSSRIAENEVHIIPQGLLWQKGIQVQDPQVGRGDSFPIVFPSEGDDLGFDLLSASFYLATRYEEYLPAEKDGHGRYDFRDSLAYRHGFLDRPLINEWMKFLRSLIRQKNTGVFIHEPGFSFVPTYDIDIAFAYYGRSVMTSFGGWMRDLVKGNMKEWRSRVQVLSGVRRDPYDVYEWLDALHLRYRLRPVYFFLLARKRNGVDRNTDRTTSRFAGLVKYHAAGYQTGLHPSWQSGDDDRVLAEEREYMESLTGIAPTNSRQHYIRMQLPESYQRLLALGIRDDYSMGYGSVNGFRASLSSPHLWYDLQNEAATPLRVHPFCFMDATSRFAEGNTASEGYQKLKKMHDVVKASGGRLYTIFHNSMLSEFSDCSSWREMYSLFLQEVVYWDL